MRRIRECLKDFACRFGTQIHIGLKNERGQTLIEYGLLLILIAVVVMAGVAVVGAKANNLYSNIGSTMPPR